MARNMLQRETLMLASEARKIDGMLGRDCERISQLYAHWSYSAAAPCRI